MPATVRPRPRTLALLALVLAFLLPAVAKAAPGDIFVANYGAKSVSKVDGAGTQSVVSDAGLVTPEDLVWGADGKLLVLDEGSSAIVRVDPVTGAQTPVTAGDNLVSPNGMGVDGAGNPIVASSNNATIVRVNPATGAQDPVTSGDHLAQPWDAAVAPDGTIYVVDLTNHSVVSVNPVTGAQAVVTSGVNLDCPSGIVVTPAGKIYVANFCSDEVYEVNPTTGDQTLAVPADPSFAEMSRLGLDNNNNLLLIDESASSVSRYDFATGLLTPVASGDHLSGPYGVAVEPAPPALPAPPPPPAPANIGPAKFRLAVHGATINLRTGRGSAKVRCSNIAADVCVVKLVLEARVSAHRAATGAKRRLVRIGTLRGTVPGGKTRKVAIKLNRRGRALLRKARHHRLAVAVVGSSKNRTGTATKAKTSKLVLKGKLPRKRHH